MPGWLMRNWPSVLVAAGVAAFLAGADVFERFKEAGWEQPGRPVFSVDRVEVLSDGTDPQAPSSRTFRAKFVLRNTGNMAASDFLFVPSFGGTQSSVPDDHPTAVPPGQALEAVTSYSRPEAASMSPVEIKAKVTYARSKDRYTQEWFFVYRPERRAIEAVSRPVFVVEGVEVLGDEADPLRQGARTLRARFLLRNSGNLPAEDIRFVPSFGGRQSPDAPDQPSRVLPGDTVEVNASYIRAPGDAAAPLEVKANLNYRYSMDHYTQEWFFVYHPERRSIEPMGRSVFVVEKVQVLQDGPHAADPSKRVLTVRFSIRNTGDRAAEGFTLMPSFDGREAGGGQRAMDVAPGQALEVTANYERAIGEVKTPVAINVRLGYSYAGAPHDEAWAFLYHADRKAIELSEFRGQ